MKVFGTADVTAEAPEVAPRKIYFERVGRLHTVLPDLSPNEGVENLDAIRTSLKQMCEMKTSRRGSNKSSHPLVIVDEQIIPKALPARTPTKAAATLCDYLEEPSSSDADKLEWLVELW